MKSFRQFLTEAPWVNPLGLDVDTSQPHKMIPHKPYRDQRGKYLPGSMGDDHRIMKVERNNQRHVSYYLHNIETKNIEMAVHGKQVGNKFFVSQLNGYAGSKFKAHEFYHHLITKHDIHLHSDYEQSTGGMKVWKALHKMPGIHIQSFNGSSETYSELKPDFQRKYDMDSSTRLAAKKK